MVLGGKKWSERLHVCDPRVHGGEALLEFLQFPLALQSVFAHHFVAWRSFHSLEVIS